MHRRAMQLPLPLDFAIFSMDLQHPGAWKVVRVLMLQDRIFGERSVIQEKNTNAMSVEEIFNP